MPYNILYDDYDPGDFDNDLLREAGFYHNQGMGSPSFSRRRIPSDPSRNDDQIFEWISAKLAEAVPLDRFNGVYRFEEHRLEKRFSPCFLLQLEDRYYQGSLHDGSVGIYASGRTPVVASSLEEAKARQLFADRYGVFESYGKADRARKSLGKFAAKHREKLRLDRLSDKYRQYLNHSNS